MRLRHNGVIETPLWSRPAAVSRDRDPCGTIWVVGASIDQSRAAVRRAFYLTCTALVIAACSETSSGGSSGTTTTTTSPSARQLEVNVHESQSGVGAHDVLCSFDGERQLLASGVVRNGSTTETYVSIEVRFIDAKGVRVDLSTDSVSALQPGESARWDVSSYPSGASEATGCVVSLDAS